MKLLQSGALESAGQLNERLDTQQNQNTTMHSRAILSLSDIWLSGQSCLIQFALN